MLASHARSHRAGRPAVRRINVSETRKRYNCVIIASAVGAGASVVAYLLLFAVGRMSDVTYALIAYAFFSIVLMYALVRRLHT